ncbi:response regulator transcription factor [Streptomyces sp. NPDC093085]|uniref:response regulator transcription factor n=1 Tax=Streptomyces sp. NPDC093085 TaxID=3155068 RepID=UPI00342CF9D3
MENHPAPENHPSPENHRSPPRPPGGDGGPARALGDGSGPARAPGDGSDPARIPSDGGGPARIPSDGGGPVRVLVVDDEPDLTEVLSGVLTAEGWQVRTAADGASALAEADAFRPHAVVLDWMLPDTDGLRLLRALRAELGNVCVLFLTARDSVEDRIAGITAGGDDYVTKPFSLEEVLARLRGLLRRAGVARGPAGDPLVVGDLVMDEEAREVTRGGELVDLSRTEFELLRFLMRNPRRVLSKALILDRVWSYDFGGRAHVVELYISYLRKKIDAGRPPMIHTVRGMGYVLKPEPR